MADFDKIHEKVIVNEGGYVLHAVPGDRGGMTYAGISRNNWPNWYGWSAIDQGGFANELSLYGYVHKLYVENFWNPIHGALIQNDRIAYSVYDFAVNTGVKNAVCCAQSVFESLKCDGIVGEKTLSALNTVDLHWFMAEFTLKKIEHYRSICNKNKSQSKFLLGWLNRTIRVHDGL